jgi:general secretion pathway protein B
MSIILEALRKAEKDKSRLLAESSAKVSRPTTPWWPLAGATLLTGAGVFWLLRGQSSVPATPVSAPASAAISVAASVAEPAVLDDVIDAGNVDADSEIGESTVVESPEIVELSEEEATALLEPPAPVRPEKLAEKPVEKPVEKAEKPATPPVVVAEKPADKPSDTLKPIDFSKASGVMLPPAKARHLKDMPNSYRDSFPPLIIEVHFYDPKAAKRFIMVAGRRYRQGDTLVEGPKVAEITNEEAILAYNGEKVSVDIPR